MLRLFVAIGLPQEIRQKLLDLHTGIEKARWIKPGQIHLTLRFIGDSFSDQTELLKLALSEIRQPEFEFSLRGVSTFPSPGRRGRAKVLMVEIEDGSPLFECQAEVEQAVQAAGFRPEQKGYHPHITLARFAKAPGADLRRWLKKRADFSAGPIAVKELQLIRSELRPDGAIHTVLESFALA